MKGRLRLASALSTAPLEGRAIDSLSAAKPIFGVPARKMAL